MLIEWFCYYPLEEISENVFKFPNYGLYESEKLIFKRDAAGSATEVNAASVVFKRRPIDGENGATFRIQALRPLEDLKREALAARPPDEKGDFRKPDLVDVTTLDPTIKLDIRYATTNNFLSTPLYKSARAFFTISPACLRATASALLRSSITRRFRRDRTAASPWSRRRWRSVSRTCRCFAGITCA